MAVVRFPVKGCSQVSPNVSATSTYSITVMISSLLL